MTGSRGTQVTQWMTWGGVQSHPSVLGPQQASPTCPSAQTHPLCLLINLSKLLFNLFLLFLLYLLHPLTGLQHLAEALFTLPVGTAQLRRACLGWGKLGWKWGHLQLQLLQSPSLFLLHLLSAHLLSLLLPPQALQTLALLLLRGQGGYWDVNEDTHQP